MRHPLLLCIQAASAIAPAVNAHHSALIFDRDSVVAFEGTVTQFGRANPHVYIINVETTGEAGNAVEWENCPGGRRGCTVPDGGGSSCLP